MNSMLASVAQAIPQGPITPVETGSIQVTLLVSAILFGMGMIGFLTRRNLILMFLCTELMFQAAAIAMVAFGRMHLNVEGQVFVIFILTVAAAEAALALALVVLLYRRKPTLDADAWSELGEC